MAVATDYTWGTGRRKSSVARVRIRPGTGTFVVNKKPMKDYFPMVAHQQECVWPLESIEAAKRFDVFVNVQGGGPSGQAGAVRLGLARALVKFDESNLPALRADGHTTRDPRMKERKKYGLHGARRATQFSKR
ncbi:MAG TPA: 30S ribosomal protein S9 [Planctomycetes bacterium]|nr:30S ribosomal protein S9 [Planctomycetota bacterium]